MERERETFRMVTMEGICHKYKHGTSASAKIFLEGLVEAESVHLE